MVSSTGIRDAGNTAYRAGDYCNAEQLYTEAIAEENSDHQLYLNRSNVRSKLGKTLESLSDAKICIEMCPTSAKGWFWKAKAEAQHNELENAIDSYLKCLELDPELRCAAVGVASLVIPWCSKQSLAVGCLETVDAIREKLPISGLFKSKSEEVFDANRLKFYIDALHLTRKTSILPDVDPRYPQALVFVKMAKCLSKLQRLRDAIMCYFAALEFLYELENNEERSSILTNLFPPVKASIQFQLGKTYRELKMIKQGKFHLQKALKMQQMQGDSKAERETHTLLGEICLEAGLYEDAIENFQCSLSLIDTADQEMIFHNTVKLVEAYGAIGLNEKVIEYLRMAAEQAKASQNWETVSKYLSLMGPAYSASDQVQLAEACFLESTELKSSPQTQLIQLCNLANLKSREANKSVDRFRKQQLWKAAIDSYRHALVVAQMANRSGNIEEIDGIIALIKSELSDLLTSNDDVAEARAASAEAIELSRAAVEWSSNSSESKFGLASRQANYGYCIMAWAVRQTDENIKQTALISAIENFLEAESMFDVLWKKLQWDQSMISWESGRVRDLTCWIPIAYILSDQYDKAFAKMEQRRSKALVKKLGAKSSESQKNVVPETTWLDCQEYARSINAVFIFFSCFSREKCLAWVVSSNQRIDSSAAYFCTKDKEAEDQAMSSSDIPVMSNQASHVLRSLTADLCNSALKQIKRDVGVFDLSALPTADSWNDIKGAQEQYKIWWKPIEALLRKHDTLMISRVIIIPDGDAWNIPFALLADECNNRLTEQFTLSIAPSISTLKLIDRCSKSAAKCGRLVVGNPAMPNITFLKEGNLRLCQLPHAEEEAIEVAKQLSTTPLCGKFASKKTICAQIQDCEIVHFATHGFVTRVKNESFLPGGLVLSAISEGESDSIDSCCLLSEEIQQFDLSGMKLAVLSCCHSGAGEVKPEGLIGLGRAFLYAGCQCVIVALWKVPDLETRLLMNAFYAHYLQNFNAPAALRDAQLSRAKQGSKPSSWGAWYALGL